MKIGDALQQRKPAKLAPHQLADATNLIEQEIGFTGKYGRGYWLRRLKGKNLNNIYALIKKAKAEGREPAKYLSFLLKK